MPIPSYTITCTRNVKIATDIYEIAFSKPEGFTFKPGQFVLLDVPLVEKPDDIQTRAFSIASAPAEKELLFAMKLKPGGRASRWIVEVLKKGVTARMQGPFGNFLFEENSENDTLMIATSTGIAPFRSQLRANPPKPGDKKIDLIFGVRSEADLFWTEEINSWTKQFENFFLHIALSVPSENWKGHRGRVQTLVPLLFKDFTQKSVYLCGSPEMTKELKKTCIETWGIDKKHVHAEGYI